jgi:hypothetical protein
MWDRLRFSPALRAEIEALVGASRSLRRDRELAFYGSEDLLPTAFYKLDDAEEARRQGHHVVAVCEAALRDTGK